MHEIIELWHWRVTDKVSRRQFITRHRMTQADALDFDPAAERVEGPDGHFKFPHLWPLKLPQAGRSDYGFPDPV